MVRERERDVWETWDMEERRRELVGRLTVKVVGSDTQGIRTMEGGDGGGKSGGG